MCFQVAYFCIMKSFKNILKVLSNKYIITLFVFIVWLCFFDANSLVNQHRLNVELKKVQLEKEFYISEIAQDQKIAHELISNEDNLERFAREEFYMKRDNEDVYVIIVESEKEKKARLSDPKKVD